MLESAFRELRHAVRGLLAARSFPLVAVVTLALGIVMTTAAYGLVDAVLLRPWPYADPDAIVRIGEHETRNGSCRPRNRPSPRSRPLDQCRASRSRGASSPRASLLTPVDGRRGD